MLISLVTNSFFPLHSRKIVICLFKQKKIEIVLEHMNKMFFCVMGVFVIVLMFVLL